MPRDLLADTIESVLAAGGSLARGSNAVTSALASSAIRTSDGPQRFVTDMSIENSQLTIGPTEIVTLPRIKLP